MSCTVQAVRNVLFPILKTFHIFLISLNQDEGSWKKILRNSVQITKKKKLKDVCRRRWVERIHGIGIFQDLFVAIVNTFEDMSMNNEQKCNRDTSSRGTSVLNVVTTFEFRTPLVVTRKHFDITSLSYCKRKVMTL